MSADSVAPRRPPEPIPLTLLTGFLGAGKTTLLNRLLKDPALAETAVIINEFGDVGLDHLLVQHVSDNLMLLQSGCLCCTMRGDLVDALEMLLRDLDNGRCTFKRVLLETTGLADPAPVLHTAMSHPYLVMRYRLDGVVTVVDALNGLATLDTHPEAVKQAAVADRIVLTKTDLLDDDSRRESYAVLLARLKTLNPAAPHLDAARDEATADRLLGAGLYDPKTKIPDVTRWLASEAYEDIGGSHPHGHAHDHGHGSHHGHGKTHRHDANRHDDHIRAFSLTTDDAVAGGTIEMFLELLRANYGANLLRMKGILKLAEDPEHPVVVHGVQHVFHPPATLERWPDDDRRTRFVFIVRDIEPKVIRDLFNAFTGTLSADAPDKTALVNNPLVPFGGMFR